MKSCVRLSLLAVMVGFVLVSGANAAMTPGTYGPFEGTHWSELFYGGSAGQVGNELQAYRVADATGPAFNLSGTTLVTVGGSSIPGYVYETLYTGGLLTYTGAGGTFTAVPFDVTVFSDGGNPTTSLIRWEMTGSGLTTEGQMVHFISAYSGLYGSLPGTPGGIQMVEPGKMLSAVTVDPPAVPVPGAVVLGSLGSCLVGFIKRRRLF